MSDREIILQLVDALEKAKRELGCYLACGGTPPTTQRAYDAADAAINLVMRGGNQ